MKLSNYSKVIVPLVMTIMIFAAMNTYMPHNIYAQSENDSTLSGSGTTATGDNATVSIPISKGFVDGKVAYFIATDASDKQIVSSVSNTTDFRVNYAPVLADTNESTRQQGYVFVNGMKGEGPMGSQMSVASALPEDEGYSPLFEINYVKWNTNATKDMRVLKSVDEIMAAQEKGELTITKSNVVINSPAITLSPP